MSTDRDTTRLVRSWLVEGATALPDQVLDAVLDQLPATHQRRAAWWPARRIAQMNSAANLGLAAAAVVVVVALFGFNYLISPNFGGPDLDDPSSSPIPTAMPTPQPLPARGLPGARGGPAGEYGWDGQLGTRTGMHRVVGDGEATAIFFAVEDDCLGSNETSERVPVTVAGFEGTYVEPYEPAVAFNNVGDEITRAYELNVGRMTLCVYVTWHPTTIREDIDAALDILDSIRAQELGDVLRINFTLPSGWDTG